MSLKQFFCVHDWKYTNKEEWKTFLGKINDVYSQRKCKKCSKHEYLLTFRTNIHDISHSDEWGKKENIIKHKENMDILGHGSK